MPQASTPTFGVVKAPEAQPPVCGLLPTAQALGLLINDSGEDPDEGFEPGELTDENDAGQRIWDMSPGPQGARSRPQRWEDGYAFLPEQEGQICGVFDPCQLTAGSQTMVTPANPSRVDVMPWYAVAGDICSTFGWEAHDYIGRATRTLLAQVSYLTAYEFWTGFQAQSSGWPNYYLASPSTDDISAGVARNVSDALDMLEQAIAVTGKGQRGAIHCTPQLGSAWSQLGNTLRTIDGLIITYRGTVIIADAGYPGEGPNNTAPESGAQWAYGTLLPTVRMGAPEVYPESYEDAINRTINTLEFRAMALVGVSVNPCTQVACKVNLPLVQGAVGS